jgi:hypothetical protein
LLIGYKPVVGLLLLRCADVARYRLPNHRNPPIPQNVSTASSIPDLAPGVAWRADSVFPQPRMQPGSSSLGIVFPYFIAHPGE